MSKKKKKKKSAKVEVQIQPKKKNEEVKIHLLEIFFLSLSIFYLECVLKFSTTRSFGLNILFIALFSLAYGLIGWVLSSLSSHMKVNKILRLIFLLIPIIWTGVNYFIYYTFKVFYDLNTVFAGGADAATGFADQIFGMVFSWNGISHIALFILPVVILLLFPKQLFQGIPSKKLQRLFACGGIVSSLIISLLSIDGLGYWNRLTDEYSYQTSVSENGLMTSFILDLFHFNHSQNVSFSVPVEEEVEDEIEEVVVEEVVYHDQVLEIDFASLAQEDTGVYAQLDEYVASLTPTKENEYTGLFAGKNLIMISAEAFSGYVIDEEVTPTLYRMANKGIQFLDYYQPASAGTTGGEYENIFGMLPTNGGSSFKMTSNYNNYTTIGNALDRLGYNGWAFHANDYTYYSRHITHNNIGYSNGFMGYGNGLEEVITRQWPQSDLEMVQGTIDMYLDHEPFNVYYMSVSGHNPYSTGGNKMSNKNYERVAELDYSEEIKCYIAANLELEDAMTYLIEQLEEKGIADDTVIVIAADHFPYGISGSDSFWVDGALSELYGKSITNYLERDENRLIIWSGCLEDEEPIVVDTPTFSLDILPTLCNLFDVEWDSRLLPGRDVFSDAEPLVFNISYDWKTDKGTYLSSSGVFTPNEGVEVSDTYVERIRTIVRNKINYCDSVLDNNYFTHLFGEKTDPIVEPIPYEFPTEVTEESEGTETSES